MKFPIETEGLSRSFGRNEVLCELNLQVPEGAVFAFLGPNGAGKTTTIRLLMNLLRPSAGRASVLGNDCTRLGVDALRQIGFVAESQELPEWMTVDELLAYTSGFYPSWDAELSDRLLGLLDLPRRRRIDDLSRGMRMKAALAVSLAYRPRVLLLDEPFSGLDPLVRDEMAEAILEIASQEGQTILVSSHDVSEIEHLSDHVGFLRDGRLIAAEPMDRLTARFRRVEAATTIPEVDSGWLQVERSGERTRFIHPSWDSAAEARLRERYAGELTIQPLSLREIFVALAKQGRLS